MFFVAVLMVYHVMVADILDGEKIESPKLPPEVQAAEDMIVAAPADPIMMAAQMEGCDPALLRAIQQTECDLANSQYCVSSTGALGPFQFMPETWDIYAQDGWDIWNLLDAGRAACRMVKVLQLDVQTTREGFITRFAGLDGGLVWNFDVAHADNVWNLWMALKPPR